MRSKGSLPFKTAVVFCALSMVFFSVPTVSSAKQPKAKNVIIMISDGQGYNHVDAASLYQYGRTGTQSYEKFPVQLGMSTYMVPGSYDTEQAWMNFNYVKTGATDSAAAATAMSAGIKTYNGAIGVDLAGKPVKHLMERAEELGKATGVVSTVQLSHATPAGFVAHNISRNDYEGIAKEMILESAADVIIGCGNPWYNDNGDQLPVANNYKYVGGKSTWDTLVAGTAGADADGDGINDPWTLIQTRGDFQALAEGAAPKRLIGIPQVYTTTQQSRNGDGNAEPYVVPLTETVPTLEEMTTAALNVLDDDPDGFVLMVEGGAVDWASHANQSGRVIEEEIDFNKAVEAVEDWIQKNSSWGETLLIVTGDHECGYLTGPGSDPDWTDLVNNGQGVQPGMEWHSGDHTNSIIPFYAKGSLANNFKKMAGERDLIRGPYIDNTDISRIVDW